VHILEVVEEKSDPPGHTATMGWYAADTATGEAQQALP